MDRISATAVLKDGITQILNSAKIILIFSSLKRFFLEKNKFFPRQHVYRSRGRRIEGKGDSSRLGNYLKPSIRSTKIGTFSRLIHFKKRLAI